MQTPLIVTVMLPLLCAGVCAQSDDWHALSRVNSGARIEVVDTSLRTMQGHMVRFSETDLTVRIDRHETVVPKEQVLRVTWHRGRKRNALIGLGVGATAGTVVGVASPELGTGRCAQPWPACVSASQVATLAVWGGGLGAAVGALIPPPVTTVYRKHSR